MRPAGSASKLHTVSDGFLIMKVIARLVKEERPLPFFAWGALLLTLVSLLIGVPVVMEFARTGLVPRLPTAVLATGLMILAMLATVCGLILDTVTRGRREIKRMHYLAVPPRPRMRTRSTDPVDDSSGETGDA